VEFRRRERTSFRYVLDRRQVGDVVTLRFLRDSRVEESNVRLSRARGYGALVPRLYDKVADYYVFGGLVFSALSMEYVDAANAYPSGMLGDDIPRHLTRERSVPDEQVVFLAAVLTGDVNLGYGPLEDAVVETVDGQPVRNLLQLSRIVDQSEGSFVTFGFGRGRRVTLSLEAARRDTPGLLDRYGLASDRSAGLVGESGEHSAARTAGSDQEGATEPAREGRAVAALAGVDRTR
jgi:hypothetical protein